MELMKTLSCTRRHCVKETPTQRDLNKSTVICLFNIPESLKKIKNQIFGFTLINLLIALSISAILATNGIPAIFQSIYYIRASTSYDDLFTLIQFSRQQAVNYHSQVLLCPTIDRVNCIDDWSQTLMVFVDVNNDEIRDELEAIVRARISLQHDEVIKWNASGSRRYLRFKADGSTGNQNGRFSYCLFTHDKLYAKQIIMTMAGRARRGSESNAIEKCNA
ncbi:MAG: type IV fimbrial biogenesis protein FimT [Pseudohongiellaceae bacterium]|jgi:type IV fimbrial biogenesis protein FimT